MKRINQRSSGKQAVSASGRVEPRLVFTEGAGRQAADDRLHLLIDGWVVPPEPMTIRALPGERPAPHGAVVSDSGRFEITDLPLGLLRLRLEPHDVSRPAFATPTFEI